MNARIETARQLPGALGQVPPWSEEAEREILGAAMLAEPMPAWLEPRHFFPTQHQRIFEAVQSVGGNVARVNAWLRQSSRQWGPSIAKPVELAAMCVEARHALQMGWALQFDELRELWKQRELIECMARATVQMRHGSASHRDAIQALREHVRDCK